MRVHANPTQAQAEEAALSRADELGAAAKRVAQVGAVCVVWRGTALPMCGAGGPCMWCGVAPRCPMCARALRSARGVLAVWRGAGGASCERGALLAQLRVYFSLACASHVAVRLARGCAGGGQPAAEGEGSGAAAQGGAWLARVGVRVVCVCMCVYEREKECEYVCVYVCACVQE